MTTGKTCECFVSGKLHITTAISQVTDNNDSAVYSEREGSQLSFSVEYQSANMAYESQSFPLQPPSAFIPPKDYPTVDTLFGQRPRDPPVDYPIFNGYVTTDPYPFREAPRWGPTKPEPEYEPAEMEVQPVNHRNNKAFQLHMKNHGKFNTIKGGSPNCDNCPICKAMNVADDELTREDRKRQPPKQLHPHSEDEEEYDDYSPQIRRRIKKPQRKSVQEYYQAERGFPGEDPRQAEYRKERRQFNYLKELRSRNSVVAHVLADRVARNPPELTVFKGEYLEVVNDSQRWWECCNVAGQSGYVPHTILDTIGYK